MATIIFIHVAILSHTYFYDPGLLSSPSMSIGGHFFFISFSQVCHQMIGVHITYYLKVKKLDINCFLQYVLKLETLLSSINYSYQFVLKGETIKVNIDSDKFKLFYIYFYL